MEEFNKVLLLTSVCCMACDGEIAKEEVSTLRKLSDEQQLFGKEDLNSVLPIIMDSLTKDQALNTLNTLNSKGSISSSISSNQRTNVTNLITNYINLNISFENKPKIKKDIARKRMYTNANNDINKTNANNINENIISKQNYNIIQIYSWKI